MNLIIFFAISSSLSFSRFMDSVCKILLNVEEATAFLSLH
jgi:hypothetical protein